MFVYMPGGAVTPVPLYQQNQFGGTPQFQQQPQYSGGISPQFQQQQSFQSQSPYGSPQFQRPQFQQQQQQWSPAPQFQQQQQSPYGVAPSAPYGARRLSLESLALELNIPKLLEVKGGPDEVLNTDHQYLHDRYGVTNEEFMRIKAYKKSLQG
ncbi:UNVERIFIED_CONTAM: hypothetical protein HDU68_000959 [Siphonaria sp. JEL0065]|nr:hypothetical protein HDU68_000959 [Siphonaria sp. JEL0065]